MFYNLLETNYLQNYQNWLYNFYNKLVSRHLQNCWKWPGNFHSTRRVDIIDYIYFSFTYSKTELVRLNVKASRPDLGKAR